MEKIFNRLLVPLLIFTSNSMKADTAVEQPKLSLSAQATLSKPADEVQLSLGVVTVNAVAEAALKENHIKMQSIIDALEAAGLKKSEYQTGHFTFRPIYTPYPKNPPEDWKPSITGYEVSNAITIKTQQLELAGKFIDSAGKAGANSIEDIHFGLHDPRKYRDEVIRLATANAISDAETIAAAAHVQLVRPVSISLDNGDIIVPKMNTYRFAKIAAPETSSASIQAGEVELSASVHVIYEISGA